MTKADSETGSEADAAHVDYVTNRIPHLRRTAYLLCGDWADGDDLVQRALTQVYATWDNARRADNLDAYVHTILVHRFIDERRRPWSRVRLFANLPEHGLPDHGQAPPDDAAQRIDLRRALRQLPPRQRAVLVLRFLCDMSVEDTAAALSCSTGTVKSQTSDGLAALRRKLTANTAHER